MLTICLAVNRNTRKLKPITMVCHDHCTTTRKVTENVIVDGKLSLLVMSLSILKMTL